MWFARLDQVCDHVQRLVAEGRWAPHYETFPLYESLLHEFSKDRWTGQRVLPALAIVCSRRLICRKGRLA